MERLHYIDMTRGFAVLWMIFCQLADMFSSGFDLYNMHWFQIANWFPFFMVIAGFSVHLAFQKYGFKQFYTKILKRLLLFMAIGIFLTYWCEFSTSSLFIFDNEIIFAIGINSALLSVLFLFSSKIQNKLYNSLWFGLWTIALVVVNELFKPEGCFNPVWILSFMTFGVLLSYMLNPRHLRPFQLASLSIYAVPGCLLIFLSYYQRNTAFWIFNNILIVITILVFTVLQEKTLIQKILSYFGRHSLFFYFFHFAIFQRLLLSASLFKTFTFSESILLTVSAIMFLIGIEQLRHKREKFQQPATPKASVFSLLKDLPQPLASPMELFIIYAKSFCGFFNGIS